MDHTLYHGHPCPSFWLGPELALGLPSHKRSLLLIKSEIKTILTPGSTILTPASNNSAMANVSAAVGGVTGASGAPTRRVSRTAVLAKVRAWRERTLGEGSPHYNQMKAKLLAKSGHASFRATMGVPWQERCILMAILGRDVRMLSGCGSGKGGVISLMAHGLRGITFYIVPLVAVAVEFVQRCKAIGVEAFLFRGAGGEDEAAMVRLVLNHPRTAPAVVLAVLPGALPL